MAQEDVAQEEVAFTSASKCLLLLPDDAADQSALVQVVRQASRHGGACQATQRASPAATGVAFACVCPRRSCSTATSAAKVRRGMGCAPHELRDSSRSAHP